jgi:protein-disulfide isomerase
MIRKSRPGSFSVRAHWRTILDVVTTAVVLLATALLLWNMTSARHAGRNTAASDRSGLVAIEDSPTRGNPQAKVAVLEYSDFECPFCAKAFHDILPAIDVEYIATGKVLFVFRHLPLPSLHPGAFSAAVASECAARQGKFWPLHDRLYAHRGQIRPGSIREDVVAMGGDVNRWDDCMSSGDAKAAIERESAEARAIGIRGTPTFLIGLVVTDGHVRVIKDITGVGTIPQWRSVLDGALAEHQ